jgi:hypothetical protein
VRHLGNTAAELTEDVRTVANGLIASANAISKKLALVGTWSQRHQIAHLSEQLSILKQKIEQFEKQFPRMLQLCCLFYPDNYDSLTNLVAAFITDVPQTMNRSDRRNLLTAWGSTAMQIRHAQLAIYPCALIAIRFAENRTLPIDSTALAEVISRSRIMPSGSEVRAAIKLVDRLDALAQSDLNLSIAKQPRKPKKQGKSKKSPTANKDGPEPPDAFVWRRKRFDGLQRIPWKLLNFVWRQKGKRCEQDNAIGEVWGHEQVSTDAVKAAVKKINHFLTGVGYTKTLSQKAGYFVIS